jgi:hypothetical protein
MRLSGFKTHPLWYAHVGREAKKETVVKPVLVRISSRETNDGSFETNCR